MKPGANKSADSPVSSGASGSYSRFGPGGTGCSRYWLVHLGLFPVPGLQGSQGAQSAQACHMQAGFSCLGSNGRSFSNRQLQPASLNLHQSLRLIFHSPNLSSLNCCVTFVSSPSQLVPVISSRLISPRPNQDNQDPSPWVKTTKTPNRASPYGAPWCCANIQQIITSRLVPSDFNCSVLIFSSLATHLSVWRRWTRWHEEHGIVATLPASRINDILLPSAD